MYEEVSPFCFFSLSLSFFFVYSFVLGRPLESGKGGARTATDNTSQILPIGVSLGYLLLMNARAILLFPFFWIRVRHSRKLPVMPFNVETGLAGLDPWKLHVSRPLFLLQEIQIPTYLQIRFLIISIFSPSEKLRSHRDEKVRDGS